MKSKETFKANDKLRQLRDLATLPDDQIDTSDIPELTADQIRRAVRRYPSDSGNRKQPAKTDKK